MMEDIQPQQHYCNYREGRGGERQGGREAGREREREGREGGRERGREGGREAGREREGEGREGEREGREGGRNAVFTCCITGCSGAVHSRATVCPRMNPMEPCVQL